jgi:hypothetical protein
MDEAKQHLRNMGPTPTCSALGSLIPVMIGPKNDFSFIHAIGILLFAYIIDLGTNSYHLCRAALAAGRSACGSTGARRRAEQKVLSEIFQGFPDRVNAVLIILIRLRLETPATLSREQFQRGNLDLYWTLTLGFTAFTSRRALDDSICVASACQTMSSWNDCPGRQLAIDDCPAIGLPLFKLIHSLKSDLVFAGLSKQMTTQESAAIIEKWAPRILGTLKESEPMDETVDPHLRHTLETLRKIRLEIKRLPVPDPIVQDCLGLPLELARGNHDVVSRTFPWNEFVS